MSSQTEEKAELMAVLSSDRFARSPQLAKLLEYLCTKYFEGQSDQIKEYNIATEVLGRPVNFDPSQDAIARVEAYRLRRKLQDYYSEEGCEHTIRIVLARGKYVPTFQSARKAAHAEAAIDPPSDPSQTLELEMGEGEPLTPVPEPAHTSFEGLEVLPQALPAGPLGPAEAAGKRWPLYALLAGGCIVAALVATTMLSRGAVSSASTHPLLLLPHAVAGPDANSAVLRVLAGSPAKYTDKLGNSWDTDRYYGSGRTVTYPPRFIARTTDPELFENARTGTFFYDIPLKPGTYELHLLFAELMFGAGKPAGGGEGSRTFLVKLNGAALLDSFDVLADADGADTADVRVFRDVHPAPDGILHLQFFPEGGEAMLSGIEILPGIPGAQLPIRLVTQEKAVRDHSGRVWNSDNFYQGGRTMPHGQPVSGTIDTSLYAAERFGHFSYAIPVDPRGSYSVALHFTEAYWGSEYDRTEAGAGSRVFNLDLNGTRLLSNFDIFREAGGFRPVVKMFRHMRPNAQGKLMLSFEPVVNYAIVSAIDVEDEGS